MRRIIIIILLLISFNVSSQEKSGIYNNDYHHRNTKIAIISGKIATLGNIKSFNVILKNKDLILGGTEVGANDVVFAGSILKSEKLTDKINGEPDSLYIKRKVEELNIKKAGKGDKWKKDWETTASYFLPALIGGYLEDAVDSKIPTIVKGKNTDYTMIIRPVFIKYDEFNGHSIGTYIDIVKSDNHNEIIVRLLINSQRYYSSKEYPGMEPSIFYTIGKELAAFFKKDVF